MFKKFHFSALHSPLFFFAVALLQLLTNNKLLAKDAPFKISPYLVKDDNRNFRIKFQLATPSFLSLREEYPTENKEEILVEEKFYGPELQEIEIPLKTCTGARFLKLGSSKQLPLQAATLEIPKEICQELGYNYILTPIIFGHISDTQTRSGQHLKIAQLISHLSKNISYNFLLNTGDIVDIGGKEEHWFDFFNVAKNYGAKIPLIAAIGNHDYYQSRTEDTPELFQKYLRWPGSEREGYYSLKFNHFELFIFNSNLHKLNPKQKEKQWAWLEKGLKENFENKITSIVSMHYPLISSSLWTLTDSSSREMKKVMIPLFEKYKVKLVLSGHTHLYERSLKNEVNYIVAGPAGGVPSVQTYKNPYQVFSQWGDATFTQIAVGNTIAVKTYNQEGMVIDELNIH